MFLISTILTCEDCSKTEPAEVGCNFICHPGYPPSIFPTKFPRGWSITIIKYKPRLTCSAECKERME